MAFQPAPGVAKVAVLAENQGETNVSTLYFKHNTSGAPPASALATLATLISNHWQDVMLNSNTLEYVMRGVEVTGLWDAVAPAVLDTSLAGVTGGLAGPVVPNNVSLAVKFSTGMTGRSSRGRNFWPSFLELEVNANRVDAARVSAIVAGYGDMIGSGIFATSWTWVVLSRYSGGAPRTIATTLPVTAVSVTDTVVDSMRRRLPKRGV